MEEGHDPTGAGRVYNVTVIALSSQLWSWNHTSESHTLSHKQMDSSRITFQPQSLFKYILFTLVLWQYPCRELHTRPIHTRPIHTRPIHTRPIHTRPIQINIILYLWEPFSYAAITYKSIYTQISIITCSQVPIRTTE